MDKTRFLSQLGLAAHWFLPPDEADEVLADYRELLDEAADRQEPAAWGSPLQAVRALTQRAAYGQWLLTFAALSLCLLLPAAWLFGWQHHPGLSALLFFAGQAGCLAWFGRVRRTRGPLPRGLAAGVAALPVVSAVVMGVLCWLITHPARLLALTEHYPASRIGGFFSGLMVCLGVLGAACGMFGLVKARLSDRRWRALYALGLTVTVLCIFLLSVLHSLSLDTASWWQMPLARGFCIALAGLGATGISLC